MRWRIEVKPSAEKHYLKLDRTTRRRITKALHELENVERPLLHRRVRPLTGKLKGDYRIRVGGWRILLTHDRKALVMSTLCLRVAILKKFQAVDAAAFRRPRYGPVHVVHEHRGRLTVNVRTPPDGVRA